jgi:hypothetical protein
MKPLILVISLVQFFLFSCGKDDKDNEFVDDKSNTEQRKNDENKQESPKDTSVTHNTTTEKRSDEKIDEKKKSFRNENPVAVITPLEAGDYNGKTVTVKGFVADVYKSEKVAYLNFIEKFPDNPFTAVIFASKFNDFPEIEKYKLKDVEVTGRVSVFRGKPQIILESPSQIKIQN